MEIHRVVEILPIQHIGIYLIVEILATHLTEYIGLLILWYYNVLFCIILYYGIMVSWYYGIMVLWYILFFISFLSAGVAASGNSFSEPVSEKMNMVPMETSSF